jgi:hypothetical protein
MALRLSTLRLLAVKLCFAVSTACAPRAPDAPATRDTDEAAQSVVVATRPPTRTPTAPPATPTPHPTATPVPLSPTRDPGPVRPDLQTLPPSELLIEITPDGQALLRFSNSILNAGPGILEVLGELNPRTNRITVTQFANTLRGDIEEHTAGEFVFHPDHDHFHLENFALYEVRSLAANGDLNGGVAFTDKISYCLRDNTRSDLREAAPGPVYTVCDQNTQGMSVGWIDTYDFQTPGQIVAIGHVPDGVYALRSTVDPADQLWEADEANNSAFIYFELADRRVQALQRSDALDRLRQLENP